MAGTVFFYIVFAFSLVATGLVLPFWYVLGLFGLLNAQKTLSHYTSYFWARFLMACAGVRVKVSGLENIPEEGPVLFISNHQSNFDIPVLLGSINKPKGFLAKIELSRIPVIHSWMNKMGCVFIDRGDMRQSVKAIQQCAGILKNGQSMVIFPEGTRSRGAKMGEFKKGSLRVAEKVNVPIIPVTINGTYRIMEANNGRIKPGEVVVKILSPLDYKSLPEDRETDLSATIREKIEANLGS